MSEGRHEKVVFPRESQTKKNLNSKKGKGAKEVCETRVTHHTLKTIIGGFVGKGETNSARKIYARIIMHVSSEKITGEEEMSISVSFSK